MATVPNIPKTGPDRTASHRPELAADGKNVRVVTYGPETVISMIIDPTEARWLAKMLNAVADAADGSK